MCGIKALGAHDGARPVEVFAHVFRVGHRILPQDARPLAVHTLRNAEGRGWAGMKGRAAIARGGAVIYDVASNVIRGAEREGGETKHCRLGCGEQGSLHPFHGSPPGLPSYGAINYIINV